MIFCKDEVAQRNGNILGYFLHKIFSPEWFVPSIFRFQNGFNADILYFLLAIFGLAAF
jgi:hypothetical protein